MCKSKMASRHVLARVSRNALLGAQGLAHALRLSTQDVRLLQGFNGLGCENISGGGKQSPFTTSCTQRLIQSSTSLGGMAHTHRDIEPTHSIIDEDKVTRRVIYRGKGIQIFRFLVRTKVIQLGAMASIILPLATFLHSGSLDDSSSLLATDVLMHEDPASSEQQTTHNVLLNRVTAGGVFVGCTAAAASLWFFSRRYVGEISIVSLRGDTSISSSPSYRIRISSLDFWGNRQDCDFVPEDLVPPFRGMSKASIAEQARQHFFPLETRDGQQYILSIRYGDVVDKQGFMDVLTGGGT